MMTGTVKAAKRLLDTRIEAIEDKLRAADQHIASTQVRIQELSEERIQLRTPGPNWKRWDDNRLDRIRQIEADVARLGRLIKEAEQRKIALVEERGQVLEKQSRVVEEMERIAVRNLGPPSGGH